MSKKLVSSTTLIHKECSAVNANDSLSNYESFDQNNAVNNNLDTIYGPENLFFNNIDSSKVILLKR